MDCQRDKEISGHLLYVQCTVAPNIDHMPQNPAYGHHSRVLRRLFCEGESYYRTYLLRGFGVVVFTLSSMPLMPSVRHSAVCDTSYFICVAGSLRRKDVLEVILMDQCSLGTRRFVTRIQCLRSSLFERRS